MRTFLYGRLGLEQHKGLFRLIRDLWGMIRGYIIWNRLVGRYNIEKNDAVLVLPESDDDWNQCGIKYFPFYMERKGCSRALVFVTRSGVTAVDVQTDERFRVVELDSGKMHDLLGYYCLFRFFNNIVFLCFREPRDNLSEFVLKNTNISLEELICMGIYRLREVPANV